MGKLSDDPLWNVPALPPPEGQTSNFNRPGLAAHSIVVVNAVWLSLMIVFVGLRIYTRQVITRQGLGWDDGLCLLGAFGSIVHSAFTFIGVKIGFGRHMWDIRILTLTHSNLVKVTILELVYIITIYTVKISILALYYRLFQVRTSLRILVWSGIVFCTIITIPFFGVSVKRLVRCTSLAALRYRICFATTVSSTHSAFGAVNVLSDFYIFAIPIRELHGLNMEKKRKLGVILLFMAGFIACSMSIIRLGFIAGNFGADDPFFNAALISHFTCVEINLAIICSCMVFSPAFVRRFRSSFGSAYGYVSKSLKSRGTPAQSAASTTLVQNTQSSGSKSRSKPRSKWQLSFNPPTNVPIELEPWGDGEAILQEQRQGSRAATAHTNRTNSETGSREQV